ncbi:hypothetical protein DNTS_010083 [Danionella cerebrum]|uniref:SH3 domain-containing protein n=1 Tax=Danionella cerebrum TaxID=2873325 RepID=A0A553N3L9_9TELE|nr:hypothetical protein DNTS_010083 [Danionella translucida]
MEAVYRRVWTAASKRFLRGREAKEKVNEMERGRERERERERERKRERERERERERVNGNCFSQTGLLLHLECERVLTQAFVPSRNSMKMLEAPGGLVLLLIGASLCMNHVTDSEKLAEMKICADHECSYVISQAEALEDFVASDCRFINLRRGQKIYVFTKLKPEDGAGVFWSGSVYGERYVDQMGLVGFFPSNYVNETLVFQKTTLEIPTTEMDFICA